MTRPTNLFILFSGIYLMNRAALYKKTQVGRTRRSILYPYLCNIYKFNLTFSSYPASVSPLPRALPTARGSGRRK